MTFRCESEIERAVVHARGAIVTRRVRVPAELPDGDVEIVVPGITPLMDRGTLRVKISGGARFVAHAKTSLDLPKGEQRHGRTVSRVRELSARRERLGQEKNVLVARRAAIVEKAIAPVIASRPSEAAPRDDVDARFRDALAATSLATSVVEKIDARLLTISEELLVVSRDLDAAHVEDRHASSVERAGTDRATTTATIVLRGTGAVSDLSISYVIAAARWWPTYTLRVTEGGKRATWLFEALVAQLSGEDWRGARVVLSSADLTHDARLPELASIRFGRAQKQRPRAYRAPPTGLDRLFDGYDHAFAALPPPPAAPSPDDDGTDPHPLEMLEEVGVSDKTAAMGMPRSAAPFPKRAAALPPMPPMGAAGGASPPPPMAPQAMMPMATGIVSASRAGLPSTQRMRASVPLEAYGSAPAQAALPDGARVDHERGDDEELEIDPAAWLDLGALVLSPPAGARRGLLVRANDERRAARTSAAQRIDAMDLPRGARDPRAARGMFDARYEADGVFDVPSDGLAHRVVVGTREASTKLSLVTVPREVAEVYREASLVNPFEAPLLGGPADVYIDDNLIVSTDVEHVDRGGTLTVGMGVEDRVKIARNARVEEESAGLLGGSIAVRHRVTTELKSALGFDVDVTVIDRVPVTEDKAIDIDVERTKPESKPYEQADRGMPIHGGLSWKVKLAAGSSTSVELVYVVKISSKLEIVGGNRRE